MIRFGDELELDRPAYQLVTGRAWAMRARVMQMTAIDIAANLGAAVELGEMT
jgi:hypothetical protein